MSTYSQLTRTLCPHTCALPLWRQTTRLVRRTNGFQRRRRHVFSRGSPQKPSRTCISISATSLCSAIASWTQQRRPIKRGESPLLCNLFEFCWNKPAKNRSLAFLQSVHYMNISKWGENWKSFSVSFTFTNTWASEMRKQNNSLPRCQRILHSHTWQDDRTTSNSFTASSSLPNNNNNNHNLIPNICTKRYIEKPFRRFRLRRRKYTHRRTPFSTSRPLRHEGPNNVCFAI